MATLTSTMVYHPDGVGIHILKLGEDPSLPTLAFLPGLSGIAEDGIESLGPCVQQGFNVASMSFRGRGQSTTPEQGYSIDHHSDDVGLFLRNVVGSRVTLIGNSIGAVYGVNYLVREGATKVDALVIVDHPLALRKLKKGWTEEFAELNINSNPVLKNIRIMTLKAIERESKSVDLYFQLEKLKVSILILMAPIGKGLLSNHDLNMYWKKKGIKIVEIPDSGHFIRLNTPSKFRSLCCDI